MGSVNFRLQNNQGTYLILMDYSFGSGRIRRAIGHSLDKDIYWNADKMRVKATHMHAAVINRRIENISTKVMRLANKCLDDGIAISEDMILREIKPSHHVKAKTDTLSDICVAIMTQRKQSGIYSRQVLSHYNSFLKLLLEFEKWIGYRVIIGNVDHDFLSDFKSFLTKIKNHSQNTVWRHFKELSTMLNEARKKGFVIPNDYKHFKTKEIITDKIYLNIEEIDKLYQYKYTSERIRNSVDLFVTGCYTGLRISDLSKLSKDNIRNHRGIDMIFLNQTKTGDDVVIPVHKIVQDIMNRHKGFPEVISSQKLNVNIQKAAQMCGIDQPIITYQEKGGTRHTQTIPKWKLVTSHTARRSFATNMHILGVNTKLIMNITGHKTESNLMKYIRIKNEDSALLLSNLDFFKY